MFELRAGILVPSTTCLHCGLAAARCACAPSEPRGPRHGMVEASVPYVPFVSALSATPSS